MLRRLSAQPNFTAMALAKVLSEVMSGMLWTEGAIWRQITDCKMNGFTQVVFLRLYWELTEFERGW